MSDIRDTTGRRLLATLRTATATPTLLARIGVFGDPTTVTVDPPELQAPAQAAIDAFDWSDGATTAWELTQNRNAALSTSLSRADDTAISVRAWLNAVIYLVNNRLEALGQPRVQLSEIMGVIQADPTIGDPQ